MTAIGSPMTEMAFNGSDEIVNDSDGVAAAIGAVLELCWPVLSDALAAITSLIQSSSPGVQEAGRGHVGLFAAGTAIATSRPQLLAGRDKSRRHSVDTRGRKNENASRPRQRPSYRRRKE
uniref:Uncharacterized protein n=1 Tax=Calcidiscus leptoporus TaxID=127549 RepID=A0A7S0NT59_9EUKA